MLKVKNISFAYDTQPVLKNISFEVKAGQHIAVIGESGCGKSTLLKIIYGLLDVNQGSLLWHDQKLLGPSFHLIPGHDNMKYLAQGFELAAYRSVAENIGQYMSNFEPNLKQGRVEELLEIVELVPYANTAVELLSGGQKQRVALARCLARRPELILLDEPFGNIDNYRRSALRRNLFQYLNRNKITSITATHDKTDILSFADETIVIKQGEVLHKRNTQELYENPSDYYTAALFGEVNSIRIATLYPDYPDQTEILLYPHEIQISNDSPLQVRLKAVYFKGNLFLLECVLDNQIIFIEHPTPIATGQSLGITFPLELVKKRMKKLD
ncbi:ABC transporter ATP-binding protein [Aquimarina sp. W85]|uniref:ABC transporter ATP-binding protein n=1 Tax=Aquimarina rhodophyticola TaxID=3342246 RepID=UPI00366E4E48